MRHRKDDRGFTLLELLIVVAIIGILATLLLTALSTARKRTQIGVARSHITAIKAALANYRSDMGRYPRLNKRPAKAGDLGDAFNDDCSSLYAALRNKPTRAAGGGQNSPYLEDWKPEYIGTLIDRANYIKLTPAAAATKGMGLDETEGPGADPLNPQDIEKLNTLAFQTTTHGPLTNTALVLLDPWGKPYHYREWSSVRTKVKDDLIVATSNTRKPVADPDSGNNPVPGPVQDRPHAPESFDVWSNGPNGINEFGHPDSDDVTSWN